MKKETATPKIKKSTYQSNTKKKKTNNTGLKS